MKAAINLHETYLYKVRALSNLLEKVFDSTLRKHADLTLSQFMVLAAIAQYPNSNQRQVARYLQLSAVAVKRQVDIAKQRAWVDVTSRGSRGEALQLTSAGSKAVKVGLQTLEHHVFQIFDHHNHSLNLMQHIDLLLSGAKGVIKELDSL